ncbi:BofC C-terminal domain-containing protein [Paraclostridium ghonii]|uniref:BofC C-terminal domain-containing protein n=1 Tax=Paraclostridium ghonii TaxID=29358 RepID=UPI00202CB796|nr:BofC C-terminal domain-containing protein [Paeniclostridium ghonii]MCM0166164.1 BofC C-terminal domain-containing protein [Paeniclostridium ghonii]
MFEKKKEFPWRIPIVIILGIVVLAGGIYVGFKSTDKNISKKGNLEQKKEETSAKETFKLSEDCEIWVEKTLEDGKPSKEAPTMIGTIPKDLVGKSKDEITKYLSTKYPNKSIKKLDTYEITLQENEIFNDVSKANQFAIIDNKGVLNVYKYNEKGNRELVENTEIETESLPKKVQEEVKSGIFAKSQEEIYSKLEDFGS